MVIDMIDAESNQVFFNHVSPFDDATLQSQFETVKRLLYSSTAT